MNRVDLSFAYLQKLPPGPVYESVMKVLEREILNVDEGTEFEKMVKQLEGMSPRKKLETVQQWGCRAFLGMHQDTLLGFLALQFHEHPRPVGVFRVYREKAYAHNGIGAKTVTAFINDCFSRPNYSRIEISKGRREYQGTHDDVVEILKTIKETYQGPYRITITPDTGLVEKLQ